MRKLIDLIRIATKIANAIAKWQTEGYIEIEDKWLERNNLRIILARRDYLIVCRRKQKPVLNNEQGDQHE